MANLATITNNLLADSGVDPINVVVTNGSYANPAWITALAWTKITGTPTTLSGYGITDAVPSSRTITINGVTQDLSANRTWTITAGVSSVSAGTGISVNQTTGAVTVTNTGTLTVAGTANQVLVNGGTAAANGNITLSLPQSIGTSSSPTFARIYTSGLYGTSGTGNIPIWQYDSNNPGYGIMYYESSPDYLKIDVSGNLVTGTPDFQVSPDTAYVNGYTVLHAGNYSSYAFPATGGQLNGYLTVSANWGASPYTSALTIIGTYPSITFRGSNSNWEHLQHVDSSGNFNFYGGAGYTDNNWNQFGQITTSGTISWLYSISAPTFYMNSNLVATQSWVNSQGFVTGGPYLPLAGGTLSGNLTISGFQNPHITLTTSGGSYSYLELNDGSTSGYIIKNQSSSTSNGVIAGALYLYTDNSKPTQIVHSGTSNAAFLSGGDVYIRGQVYVGGNGASTGTQLVYNSGTWGISITGNATTATTASNSNALNGWAYTSYAYRSGGTGYYQVNDWVQMNGNFGIYWPSYYGLHLYPNQSSYGALQINGSKNGWAGIYFNDSGNTLMMNSAESGHYNVSYGWQFRWYVGYLYVSRSTYGGGTEYTVLDSGNYNSYAPTLTGTGASGTWGINVTGSAGSTPTLTLTGLGSGSVNVNNANTAVYRTETGSGAVLAYAPVLHIGGGDTMWQMQGSYGTSGNGTLYFRQGYNGSWGTWLTMLSSANYNSYAPTLTGGGASGTWSINVTGTAASETLATVTGRGNSTGSNIITSANIYAEVFYDYSNNGYYMDLAGTSNIYSLNVNRAQVTNDVTTSSGQGRFGGWYTGTGYTGNAVEVGFSGSRGYVISYSRSSGSYQNLELNGSNIYILPTGGGNIWVGNQIIRQAAGQGWLSGNYASSETASTTGAIYSIGGSYYPTSSSLNTMYGVGYTHSAQGGMPSGASSWGFYVTGNGTARVWLGGDNGNIIATGTTYSYAYRGNGNVAGTGEATYHPAGIYSTGTNWLYGQMYLNLNNIRDVGGIGQSNTLSRPNVQWGAGGGTTGAVVIKLPGASGNYGMIHAVIDIYEYNSNNVCTVIVGGHNWASYWVNYGANVVGYTDKPVRVAFKDGQYCIVIGNGSSSWSYGQVVLRKIQNGTYYAGSMEIVSGITIGIESDSYTWVSGDLRQLRVPGNIYMNETIVATQSWVNSQGFVTGGPYVPSRSQSNWNDATVINNTIGMLAWKNYGNGHVIFDASASTSPSGGSINNTNSTYAWTGSYPTLMGWNGSSTYGVRVDTARYAETVSISYNNDSNSNYQLLWGSGNSVYGTGNVYVNPSTDRVYAAYFDAFYYIDVYTASGADYLRLTDNQIYRPNGGGLYVNWSSNANVYITGPSGGNVGVGNNSPSYRMHVNGDIYANGGWLRVSGTAGIYFESYAGGWRMTDSSYIRAYGGKALSMEGASVDYVSSIYMNGGVYIDTFNNRNLIVKASGAGDAGILGRGSSNQFAFQIYGSGGDYGFLNSAWGAWDIRKTVNGALYMNDNTSYYLNTSTTDISAYINGAVISNSSFATNGYSQSVPTGRVYGPKGGAYSYQGGVTGAIKIRLPFRANDSMWSMKVRIYNYSTNQTSEYTLGNYSYDQGGYNASATFIGGSSSSPQTVRFGNQGGYDCVWIGETSTSWSYPVVSVMDFTAGYANGSAFNYYKNWDISMETSFGTIGRTITPDAKFRDTYVNYYYDSSDSSYYTKPSGTSLINSIRMYGKIRYASSVADDSGFGIYFDDGMSTAYAIYREAGSWNFPYPDLRIAFHTGISMGANPNYGGIRMFSDYDMSSGVLYINNASYGGAGNVYAFGSIYATAFYETSDARVKTILEDNARVNGIELIKPKLYQKNGKTELGYIAQDFIEVMPYALSQENLEKHYSLVYREVHTAKIAYLEDSIEEIKAKILYLENQLKNKNNENN